jgi:hypothetical protein
MNWLLGTIHRNTARVADDGRNHRGARDPVHTLAV